MRQQQNESNKSSEESGFMTVKDKSLILVINPGSTSTKIALFSGKRKTIEQNMRHSRELFDGVKTLWDQFPFRLAAVESFIEANLISGKAIAAVVGRGGLLKPLRRGTYLVDENMISDARKGVRGAHVSNLGCALAFEIAEKFHCRAYTVDPVSVDEFEPLARYSGHPFIERRSLAHSLSLRAAALWASEQLSLDIEQANFVVAHLGGGISVAPVKGGRVIDVNDASSDGPFSPERTGGLPLQPFIELCFSGKYSEGQMKKMVMGEGGLKAYLGTTDVEEIEKRISRGDRKAREVFEAMAYQIAKEIGAMATVLCGEINGIVLTGGLVHSVRLVTLVKERVRFIAPLLVLEGELEMEALAYGVLRVLEGREELKYYNEE
jgi:butyrate kinase